MKSLLMGFMIFGLGAGAWAQNTQIKEKILRDEQVPSTLQLDEQSVRCSALGYGTSQLKISVPDLKWVAIFDHINVGESEPCMSAGLCTPERNPESLIGGGVKSTSVTLHHVLKEVYTLDLAAKTCQRTLKENLDTLVEGIPFFHERSADLGSFPFEFCEKL